MNPIPQTNIFHFRVTSISLVISGVIACLIITANSLVIVLVYVNKQWRTTTNLNLACLALSELLSELTAIPLIFACNLMPFVDNIAVCSAMDLASRFIAFSTILHLMIVTFERYVMIIHPMQYRKIISKQTTVASLILICIFSLSLSLIQLFWISPRLHPNADTRATYRRYLQQLLSRISRGTSCDSP